MKLARCFIYLLAVMAPLQSASAQDVMPAEEMVEARAIIATMFPPDQHENQMRQMMTDLVAQMRGPMMSDPALQRPDVRAILDAYFDTLPAKLMPVVGKHLPAMREATAIAYCREFTLDELKQLRAFSQTPAGTHYFSKVTNLVGDPAVADANKAYFVDVKVLTDTLQGELVQKLRLLRDKSQS